MTPVIPSYLEKIIPYEPGKPAETVRRELGLSEIIKLASNESPLGPPKAALEAISAAAKDLNRYPDDSYYSLKHKIAEQNDVPSDHITMGAGSAELIIYSARALLGHHDYAAISEQTFILYWLAVQSINGNIIRVPLKDYRYNLPSLAASISDKVKLVFIANPNNPTGTMVTADEMDEFMDSIPDHVVVVYDEAYREYIDDPNYPDPLKYYRRGDKIIILRTFSKMYALAGLRVGYGIANEKISDALKRVRMPFNVSSLAAVAAEAALDDDDHVRRSNEINNAGREYLTKEMSGLGLEVIPSVTNFLLVDMHRDSMELFNTLQKQGVIVRPMSAFGMPSAMRVSIGHMEENKKFIAALKNTIG